MNIINLIRIMENNSYEIGQLNALKSVEKDKDKLIMINNQINVLSLKNEVTLKKIRNILQE